MDKPSRFDAMLAPRPPPTRNAVSTPPVKLDERRRKMIRSLPDKKQFEYRRMSSEGLADAISDARIDPFLFCRLFGVDPRTMKKWLNESQEIPPWVPIALALLGGRGSHAIAREISANYISLDLRYPEHGEFPFLNTSHDTEDS